MFHLEYYAKSSISSCLECVPLKVFKKLYSRSWPARTFAYMFDELAIVNQLSLVTLASSNILAHFGRT